MYRIKTPKKIDLANYAELEKSSAKRNLGKTSLKVHWVNDRNEQCKKIIGQNRCFCAHSFQQHQIINTAKPYCIIEGCKCKCYEYVPFADIRCMCRHSYKSHNQQSRMCQMCEKCLGFSTNWSCKCGLRYNQHQTVMKFSQKTSRSKSTYKDKNPSFLSVNQTQLLDQSCGYQNQAQLSLDKSRVDQIKLESQKYSIKVTSHLINEKKKQQTRHKIISRINKKYITNNIEDHYDNNNQSSILMPPENAHETTALQLYLKPHNYRYIEIDRLLEKQYSKYNSQLSEITNLKLRAPRKF